ncbi:SDR family oxidoreductase [Citricoccus sp. NR2]|uniref:SDR family oxidoreductase n=1 Tax=Citricoccus sp. NR2 TaxID=3004095 RepID=UPI0022DCEE1E|nr:SDR family oxidoreductase [Citricoccus sp. NR2]WBL20460.1 SDR family oxidoreductase [Citricoccus sp. NR2]
MPQQRHPFPGQTVLITGGGSGIGRLMAEGAAARGARVIIWDLSAEAGEQVARSIRGRGGEATAQSVDVTDREAVNRTAQDVGGVDILINNAGIVSGKRFADLDHESIERIYAVNVLSLYWVTGAFLPGMRERGNGAVVTIASAAGLVGVARQTDYSATKFAALGFAESLRMELAKERAGVDSIVVCPYYINTGMFDGVATKFPRLLPILQPGDAATRILAAIEAGRHQLMMPKLVRALPLMRILPTSLFDRAMNVLGVNATMDGFTGRKTAAPPARTPAR